MFLLDRNTGLNGQMRCEKLFISDNLTESLDINACKNSPLARDGLGGTSLIVKFSHFSSFLSLDLRDLPFS